MIKTILIATSFANDSFNHAAVWEFRNGKFITEEEHTACSNFWIECTLPAVPHIDSLIELGNIDKKESKQLNL